MLPSSTSAWEARAEAEPDVRPPALAGLPETRPPDVWLPGVCLAPCVTMSFLCLVTQSLCLTWANKSLLLCLALHRRAPRLPASALAIYLTCGVPSLLGAPHTVPMRAQDAACTAVPDRTPTKLSSCVPPSSQHPGCPQFPAFIPHFFSPGTQTWPSRPPPPCTPPAPAKVPRAPLGWCFPGEFRKEHPCPVAHTLAGPPRGPVSSLSLPRVVPGPVAHLLSFLLGARPSAPHRRGPGPRRRRGSLCGQVAILDAGRRLSLGVLS